MLQHCPKPMFFVDVNKHWIACCAIYKVHIGSLDAVLSVSGPRTLSMNEEESIINILCYTHAKDTDY